MNSLTSLIAVSVAGAFTFAPALFADLKGGERLNSLNSIARVEAGTPAKAMNCKTEKRTAVDASARGAFKTTSVYSAHLCNRCESKEVARGAGKLAVRKIEHSCAEAARCCSPKS